MKKFISLDPSLRNTAVVFGTTEGKVIYPERYELVITRPDFKKGEKVMDIYRRYKIMYRRLHDILEEYQPDILFSEKPSGSQSFDSSASYFGTLFLLATFDLDKRIVSPKFVKENTHGSDSATKDEMIGYVQNNYPDFKLPTRKLKGEQVVVKTKAEHICDAICVAESCVKTENKQYE